LDLRAVLREVGDLGHTSLLVEGGGKLLGSLFDQQLIDRVAVFVAPKVIGGAQAPSPVAGRGVESLTDSPQIQDIDIKHLGQDILITGKVSKVHGS
jgi:diaminohydroxyphosphoribosylaminopyrimidine deaminase/5-amino-6-(5-phosphoribosylamino)uracil reductase